MAANCKIVSEVVPGIEIAMARAISTALLVNELIANAAKHAYAENSPACACRPVQVSLESKIGGPPTMPKRLVSVRPLLKK